MTYALAAELQRAIYGALKSDAALQEQIGDAIYDVVPAGQIPSTYVSLGVEDARDWSDKTGRGARHDFTISVVTDVAGFQTAKLVAGAVSDALTAMEGITAGFAFDVPVRFDTDRLMVSVESFNAGEVPSIPVVEVRL